MKKKISGVIVSSLIVVGAITAIPQTTEYEIVEPVEYEKGFNYIRDAIAGRVIEKTSWILPDEAEIVPTQFKTAFTVDHINYVNKSTGKMEPIDINMVETADGWEMKKASYEVELPKRSDQAIRFFVEDEGIDYTLSNIQGNTINVVDGVKTGSNEITYSEVATGIDLVLLSRYNDFIKNVVIKTKPIFTGDFFEIQFQTNGSFTKKTKGKLRYGKLHFRDALAEDSSGKSVDIELDFQLGKLIKRIPRSFLDNAVYPVTTDATTSFTSTAGDGRVQREVGGGTWTPTHDGAGTENGGTQITGRCENGQSGNDDTNITRCNFPFDTSSIASGDTIDSATLDLYIQTKKNDDNDTNDYMNVVETFTASSTVMENDDYKDIGYDSGNENGGRAEFEPTVEGATLIDLGDITENATNTWTLDSTGEGWIKKSGDTSQCGADTGVTCLGMRVGQDMLDHPFVGNAGQFNGFTMRMSEHTGTTHPTLNVTHSVPSARRIIIVRESYLDKMKKLFMPLALAFTK